MLPKAFAIGDWVQRSESSLAEVGRIVAFRGEDYVVVEWEDGWSSTHSRESLRLLVRPAIKPDKA